MVSEGDKDMTRSFARVLIIFAAELFIVGAGGGQSAVAKPAKQKQAAPAADGASGNAVNACGCYSNGGGACFCAKKGNCGCPGECEPKGCEEKREKELDREMAAETKKAAEADKKQRKASADAERAKNKADDAAATKPSTTKP
jgi:hypothetical protein